MKNRINEDNRKVLSKNQNNFKKIVFFLCIVLCFFPFVSPPIALFFGILIAQFVGHPYPHLNSKATNWFLKVSVVGLGFGMNANEALKAGKEGFIFTIASITSVLFFGYILGKLLKINPKTSFLVSSGTAICGGSAIAAISPVIKAEEKQISVALGIVFILNSIALIIFPIIGEYFNLSQSQFGLWSAIAIHDTSSVVGAASKYGNEALQIATTIKLARALWIIPVAFLAGFLFKSKGSKVKIPYFIGLFIFAIIINTYFPFVSLFSKYIVGFSKIGLTITLFLIGSELSLTTIKSVGFKPMLQGVLLWMFISIASLFFILSN